MRLELAIIVVLLAACSADDEHQRVATSSLNAEAAKDQETQVLQGEDYQVQGIRTLNAAVTGVVPLSESVVMKRPSSDNSVRHIIYKFTASESLETGRVRVELDNELFLPESLAYEGDSWWKVGFSTAKVEFTFRIVLVDLTASGSGGDTTQQGTQQSTQQGTQQGTNTQTNTDPCNVPSPPKKCNGGL